MMRAARAFLFVPLQLNSGVSAQRENGMTSRQTAPTSTLAPSVRRLRLCAGPFPRWKASRARPCAPRPRYLGQVVGSFAARPIATNSLGSRRPAAPDRSAILYCFARARAASRECPPP